MDKKEIYENMTEREKAISLLQFSILHLIDGELKNKDISINDIFGLLDGIKFALHDRALAMVDEINNSKKKLLSIRCIICGN